MNMARVLVCASCYSVTSGLRQRGIFRAVLFIIVVFCAASASFAANGLRIDSSGRHFIDSNGAPFFFLGDTATRMNHMLNHEEIDLYLSTRASQGYTVILASAFRGHTAEYPKPNAYGQWPFIGDDITRPNIHSGYDYWDHIDYIIDRAAAYGLQVALAAFAVGADQGGYRYLNTTNAYAYGRWIGERYANRSNVMWALGWDDLVDNNNKQIVWNEMARGIEEGAGSRALITFHGGVVNSDSVSSSRWFASAPWLDFNLIQSSLRATTSSITADRALSPVKPTGIGEGVYESNADLISGARMEALDIRRQAYWSYLAGGYHISGNLAIWGFGIQGDWRSALTTASTGQLRLLKNLLTQKQWWRYEPAQTVFASGEGSGSTVNVAAQSTDGTSVIAYLSSATTVSIRMSSVAGASVDASWFDPTSGQTSFIGNFSNAGTRSFSTPTGWQDAVLLLDARDNAVTLPNVLAAPTITSPSYGTVFPNTTSSVTLTWNAVSGATGYLLRIQDQSNSWVLYLDMYANTQITIPVSPGHSYIFWMHSATSSTNHSNYGAVRFSVNP